MTHIGEILNVSWKSRKHSYIEKFYSCCGIVANDYIDIFKVQCPRTKWISPYSAHPGNIISYSRRSSGGGRQSSSNIPYCGYAYWTCCSKLSTEEGCHFIKI